jgi:hypothetical protein
MEMRRSVCGAVLRFLQIDATIGDEFRGRLLHGMRPASFAGRMLSMRHEGLPRLANEDGG